MGRADLALPSFFTLKQMLKKMIKANGKGNEVQFFSTK